MRIIYDIETYPDIFTLAGQVADGSEPPFVFELSTRKDERDALMWFLKYCRDHQIEMVGFNNLAFDYPVLHRAMMLETRFLTSDVICSWVPQVFKERWGVPKWKRIIPQIDLYKIHHFDNMARNTSLKKLQFNMRSASVDDLPFTPGVDVGEENFDDLIEYNFHDVTETRKFYEHSLDAIKLREALLNNGFFGDRSNADILNFNDTKIGKNYFIGKIIAEGIQLYKKDGGENIPIQTKRDSINLSECIFPNITFATPDLQRVHRHLQGQVIRETKGVFTGLSALLPSGFSLYFGTGGLHGSVDRKAIRAVPGETILDLDVTSYYPSIAIKYRLAPEHIGSVFPDIYQTVKTERVSHAKGTPFNAALKLALNGVYGDSNNKYSPLFDPKVTMTITISGQLMLAMLAEALDSLPCVELIQVNTDGLTIRFPNALTGEVDRVADTWQRLTGMDLESARYNRMFIRDVNNYIAEYNNGDVKLKGAYVSDREWHKDHSALIVPKVAERVMLNGEDPEKLIREWIDPFDFMLLAKAPSGSHLELGGRRMPKNLRYYVVKEGDTLIKVSPPRSPMREGWFKKASGVSDAAFFAHGRSQGFEVYNPDVHTKLGSKYETRRIGFMRDPTDPKMKRQQPVAECNVATKFDWSELNRGWYLQEVEKLLIR